MAPVTATQAHLASKDDNLMDCPCGLIFQELTDEEATCVAGPDDSEVLVTRHVLVQCMWEEVLGQCMSTRLFIFFEL